MRFGTSPGLADAGVEVDLRAPAECRQLRDIEKLARGSVWL
jgi:hypothetical protein